MVNRILIYAAGIMSVGAAFTMIAKHIKILGGTMPDVMSASRSFKRPRICRPQGSGPAERTKYIGAQVTLESSDRLNEIAATQGRTNKQLLHEALELLFAKYAR